MTVKLAQDTLSALPPQVAVPAYDRSALTPGILHIGVGNFHRAHQAVYLDRLFDLGHDHDWAVIGAGILPGDAAMRHRLKAQDCLTTVIELAPDGLGARVCGAMIDFTDTDAGAIVSALCRPEIRIVSLTITEGGYFVDAKTGGFDTDNPQIRGDIENADDPRTVFGILVAGLKRRKDAGLAPFTLMSCDNLPENGDVTRNAVVGLATAIDPEFGDWIARNVAFPNGMVDCITPATSDRERAMVCDTFGIADAAPVTCEPFRQWVLEDHFPAGRPALERVGVEFVDDVAPYELMKLRILNGGHGAIAYPAALLGLTYAHEAMAHPLIGAYLEKLELEEIIPTVPPIDGVDFNGYLSAVVERFSNPAVRDTVSRLCLDGSNRQPKFILPAIRERIEKGLPVEGLALEVALWARFCAGTDDEGREIVVEDENAEMLKQRAIAARSDPSAFLEMESVFGGLHESGAFRSAFADALQRIWAHGTGAVLRDYIQR
ncbi:mannitol dehydrogenase family protein [Hoeflea poritis]|uniref:Mannitol dehydrogenase family protein n=1 Tax=Hoeflea poritis TaxID=2993659 RepID=A0ABT4VRY2_9HYPH|nr:mannitol dehydrogenase family protein [Hoeflea poritis]MDA4847439.1 mannitol dehydrogenase family protein [Hoeflea poritis]